MLDALLVSQLGTPADADLVVLEESGSIHAKQHGRYGVYRMEREESKSFRGAFENSDVTGMLRTGFIYTDEVENGTRHATAVGAQVGAETAAYYGFHLGAKSYISQNVTPLSGSAQSQNTEFFDASGDSYAYLAEAHLAYEDARSRFVIGRIHINTPFADSDDIRMAPNTFEGAWGYYYVGKGVSVQLMYLHRWAGVDSGESPSVFKPLNEMDNTGLHAMGVTYDLSDFSEASLWYYHVGAMAGMAYAEFSGHIGVSESMHIEYGIQAANMQERGESAVEGSLLGAMVLFDREAFFFGSAVNWAFAGSHHSVIDGFGGGPFYTSLDEQTIGALSEQTPGEDATMLRFGAGAKLDVVLEGMLFEAVYGKAISENGRTKFTENDLILTYEHAEDINLEVIYANRYDAMESDGDESFERLVIRIDYNF